jgi:hypothetical protein
MPRKNDRPDIEIGAALKAKKLRFKRVPKTEVRWSEDAGAESERKNLPDQVEPGKTYRDVEVRWYAQGRLTERWSNEEVRKTTGRNEE